MDDSIISRLPLFLSKIQVRNSVNSFGDGCLQW
jgi:hypothetical protein